MSFYPGASPEKNEARSWAYNQVPDLLTKKHLVIAGLCGDIFHLLRQGVSQNRIHAIDTCIQTPMAVSMAKALRVKADKLSIENAVAEIGLLGLLHFYGSINIDLCNGLRKGIPVLNSVLDTLAVNNWEGIVVYTFSYGRDRMHSFRDRIVKLNNEVFRRNKNERIFSSRVIRKYRGADFPMAMVVIRIKDGALKCVRTDSKGVNVMAAKKRMSAEDKKRSNAAKKAWETRRKQAKSKK